MDCLAAATRNHTSPRPVVNNHHHLTQNCRQQRRVEWKVWLEADQGLWAANPMAWNDAALDVDWRQLAGCPRSRWETRSSSSARNYDFHNMALNLLSRRTLRDQITDQSARQLHRSGPGDRALRLSASSSVLGRRRHAAGFRGYGWALG